VEKLIVVNKTFVNKYLPDENPIGKYIKLESLIESPEEYKIIGIVADFKSIYSDTKIYPQIFMQPSKRLYNFALIGRNNENSADMISLMRSIVHQIDPEISLHNTKSLEDIMKQAAYGNRALVYITQILSWTAIIICIIGIYSVVSHNIVERMNEIGIRMAVGATVLNIIIMIIKYVLSGMFIGIICGAGGGIFFTRYLASIIYGMQSNDPAIFAATILLIVFAGIFASLIPLIKLRRLNIASTLKQ
jgi:ABC-type antimicrobial peptide transport system permease subunit